MITIKVNTTGLEAKIDKAKKGISETMVKELNRWAVLTSNDAKNLAPIDEGFLRRSISPVLAAPGNLKASVVVAANYAAYIEFGTSKFAAEYVATLPADWQTYAATFKGSTGSNFDDFVLRLVEWIKRKGIDVFAMEERGTIIDIETGHNRKRKRRSKNEREAKLDQVAYLIARKIMIEGLRPRPFLFPAVQSNTIKLKERFKT